MKKEMNRIKPSPSGWAGLEFKEERTASLRRAMPSPRGMVNTHLFNQRFFQGVLRGAQIFIQWDPFPSLPQLL